MEEVAESVVTRAAELLIAAGGFAGLVNPRIDAITNSPTVSKATEWTDLTVAAYTGYGTVTPTMSAEYVSQPDDALAVDFSPAVFDGPSSGAGVDATGWVLHDTSATPVVYAVWLLSSPIGLQAALDRMTADSTIRLASTATGNADS